MGLSDCTVEAAIAVSDLGVARRFYEEQPGLVGTYDLPDLTDERGFFDAGRFRDVWVKDPDGNTLAVTEV